IAFALMHSLPDTPDWCTFASSVLNTIIEKDLTFNAIETRVITEVICQPVATLSTHTAASAKPETWCALKEGKKKKKNKAKKVDSPADSDSEVDTKSAAVREYVHISKALAKCVQAYSTSVTKDHLDIIIDSSASSHM
ncbi:hypothetical protein BDR04DRAFT_980153, partial [Suillus decipiens]